MNLFSQTARNGVTVTPHDTTTLASDAACLYVGVSGNITVLMPSGDVVTFANVPVGFFPVQVRRVNATGTTATNMLALR
jgi:hypothetical protein